MQLAAIAPLVWALIGLVTVVILSHPTPARRHDAPRIATRPPAADLRPAA